MGLSRQTFGRILFLVPIIYGGAASGMSGGVVMLVLSGIAMLPRVFIISPEPRAALFETGGIMVTGALTVVLFDALQKSKRQLTTLKETQNMLSLQIKGLSMLHIISGMVGQSLEVEHVLNTAIDKVRQLAEIEACWLYLWDEDNKCLRLAACSGLPKRIMPDLIGLGEGVDGTAATLRLPVASGEENAIFKHKALQSVLVVPLVFKNETIGTLGIGANLPRVFPSDEIELLRAIGDQISMAIVNARLYDKERQAAEALRISERNYRELFDNASDAIWVHDLKGKTLAANSALEKLTGYKRDELIGNNVSLLFPSHNTVRIDREAHNRAIRGETPGIIEQELVRKDGSNVIVQVGTSLISKDGAPWAFQHIARDITEEKRVQENLKFYVRQVTEAQEAERKRIARELHDETAQALVVVSRHMEDLASGSPQVTIKDVREQMRSILQGVRKFSQQLRPSILDDLGLLPALKWLASDLTGSYNIATEVEVIGSPRKLLPETELMLFRITQEALTNVRRHSGASGARVIVEFTETSTRVTITDNGKGFEIPARTGDLARVGKLGLAGMQERAQLLGGNLNIQSTPGKGTTVAIEVPLVLITT